MYNAVKGGTQFVSKAVRENGRILILGDQGVNRSATLTVRKTFGCMLILIIAFY